LSLESRSIARGQIQDSGSSPG